MTKTKIFLIDSLMAPTNYFNGRWTLTGTPTDPDKVEWVYLGGTQDCAAQALTTESLKQTEDSLITLVTEKDFLLIAFLTLGSSLITIIYVWKLVEMMYLNEPNNNRKNLQKIPFIMNISSLLLVLLCLYFGLNPSWILEGATSAANSLTSS